VRKPFVNAEENPDPYTVSADAWANAFIQNKTLIHFDLSFNNFKVGDIRHLGEALKLNHTLLGLHLMGNEAKVDELGYVTPDRGLDPASYHVFSRIPQVLRTGSVNNKHLLEMHITSNCWICEGWSHLEFKIECAKIEELLKNDDFRDRFYAKYGVSTKV